MPLKQTIRKNMLPVKERFSRWFRPAGDEFPWKTTANLAIELAGVCNIRCPMCSYPDMKRPRGFMKWDLFEKIVRDASENGHDISSLHFFGEPLLWPELVRGIRLLSEHDFSPRISTNGMLFTPTLARQLQDAGLKEIMVTIDTLVPEAYPKIRTGGKLEVVRRHIHEAIAAAPEMLITAQLMPTKYNVGETEEDFYREFGRHPNFKVEPWFVVRMNNQKEDVSTDIEHDPDDVDKRLCLKPFDKVVVLWTGETVLCCLDSEGELVTGDLNVNSIAESWLGPKAMHLRRLILTGEWEGLPACKKCSADHIVMHDPRWKRTAPAAPLPSKFREMLEAIDRLDRFDGATGTWTVKVPTRIPGSGAA